MTGLFERAVGEEWETLHPRVRERYGLVAGEEREAVGRGRMDDLSRHPLAVPVFRLATVDDFLFPERGTDVPFTIVSEAFVDGAGYEALHLRRRFETSPPRTFVDTLRWNPDRGCVTDLFGRRGLLAADLHVGADDGALALSIGDQWLRVGGRYLPLPGPLSAGGELRDWYDDGIGRFRVSAEIENRLLGSLFAYDGSFESEFRPVDGDRPTRSRLGGIALPGDSRPGERA